MLVFENLIVEFSQYKATNNVYSMKVSIISPTLLSSPLFLRSPLHPSVYSPNTLISHHLRTGYTIAANPKPNSVPKSPPSSPIIFPIGPTYHVSDMPTTAPAAPMQKANMAA